jgi:hypothetical protein
LASQPETRVKPKDSTTSRRNCGFENTKNKILRQQRRQRHFLPTAKQDIATMTTPTQYRQPMLPPLYFNSTGASKPTVDNNSNKKNNKTNASSSSQPELPAELLSECLTKFAHWGDLAKLACVQKSWSNILMDATICTGIDSKWELAQALLHGECGLQRNPKRAMKLFQELANIETDDEGKPLEGTTASGDCYTPAVKQIAQCYLSGTGVPENSSLGMAWLRAAYLLGKDASAAHDVAIIYEYGRHGVETDVVAAAQWFEKAATDGHVEAMSELGLCYELGCGVEQSDQQALDWYTKAAEQGHVTAKFSVGEIFEEARGVPQSDEEACLWYYRAALVGDEDSKTALRRLYDIARIVVPGVATILNE